MCTGFHSAEKGRHVDDSPAQELMLTRWTTYLHSHLEDSHTAVKDGLRLR